MLDDSTYCINPACHQLLDPNAVRCPHCGADQSAPWRKPAHPTSGTNLPPAASGWTCPSCGAIAAQEERTCPRCGFDSASTQAFVLQELQDEYVRLLQGRAWRLSSWWWTTSRLDAIRLQVAAMGISPDAWEAGLRPRTRFLNWISLAMGLLWVIMLGIWIALRLHAAPR